MDELTGIIERFIFHNPENGYAVALIQTRGSALITATGYLPNIHPGNQVYLQGTWTVNPKFGKQFEIKQCTKQMPTTVAGLEKYLASGLIKGIGPAYAKKLVDAFGTEVLKIIDEHPEQLQQVPGIGKARAALIAQGWQDQKEIANIMVFLQEKDISPTYALKIYKTYGNNALAVLNENPYKIADDIWGVGFKTADAIAHKLGLAKDSPERMRAGMLFAITAHVGNGHLYITVDQLKKNTIELLEIDADHAAPLLKHALHTLYETEKIKLISYNNDHYITLTQYYYSEKGCANKINALTAYTLVQKPFDLEKIYALLRTQQNQYDIALTDEQQQGIMTALQKKVSIITGGPGTGKTTLIKKLLAMLEMHNIRYKLAAPTGRAAKRITEGTGRHASTLHRLLEYDPATRTFVHNEHNALKLDFLIVDEASMIDIFLAHAVLKALPLPAHVLFIGDVDQLPSVGAGNFLNDLIASKAIPCTHLKQIFRQSGDSLIIVNAHRINSGEFPTSYVPEAKRDFIFIKEQEPPTIQQHLHTIYTQTLKKHHVRVEDAITLVPMNRGSVGTQAINHYLQQELNPHAAQSCTIRGTMFKVNDRVMQIRNNYDKHVFNGDIGTIAEINTADQQIKVNFQETIVEYEFSECDELVLAYAVTIHKSQGSEYQAAIIPLFMQHFTLLQRNLLYTAITRAKKLCILIGQPKAIAMAIKNNKGIIRTTFLQQYLTSDLQCR